MKDGRLEKVLQGMKERGLKQILVTDPNSIFYLTGSWIHPGERMLALYIREDGQHKLFNNELFPLDQDLGIETIWYNDIQDPIAIMVPYLEDADLGVDKIWPAKFLLALMEQKPEMKIVNSSIIVDTARMFKDEEEITLMREASRVNDIAVEKMIELIPEEYTEREMEQILGKIYSEMGANAFSFPPIISYGANGADPHHGTDDSKVKPGDAVVVDIGCIKDSYCSDTTRTVFYKHASEEGQKVYNIVKEACQKAIDIVKPGVKFSDIDKAARDHIEAAGYGEYFTHRTGHSIGIEDHDYGDVSSVNHDTVQPGMIFSIEPGIYLPGRFGVRIEDLILVTEDGHEVLTKCSKDFRIVG